MSILDIFRHRPVATAIATTTATDTLPGERWPAGSERGQRSTPEAAIERIHRLFWVDFALRQTIMDIRRMDRLDPRVKKIHLQTSRAAAKGGLKLVASGQPKWLQREYDAFVGRLHLDRRDKLESDIRGLMMEGNLPMQWVLDADQSAVVGCARMPAETIVPVVGASGLFESPAKAYMQHDIYSGKALATFALWQLTVSRLTPDNYDDWGCLGRPYLDATRTIWRKLNMTEEDMVIRRAMRAPLRMVHTLEGASEADLSEYRAGVEADQASGNYRDYYMNKKGSVAGVQGDANLDQIADVSHLLDCFFSGAPAPKGMFGFADGLSLDVLADLKADFYDELDALQDNVAFCYQQGFRLHLLLRGRNPDAYACQVQFAERRTDTPNQRADLGLKYQALGLPRSVVWEATGIDVAAAELAKAEEVATTAPYPADGLDTPQLPGEPGAGTPRVTVTPGNGRKGESATDISTTTPMP